MKKIIHVSNFNLIRLKGCFQVGFPFKISNGLIRNGYSVLNYPDRDLCRMFGFGHMNFIGRNRLNKHLLLQSYRAGCNFNRACRFNQQ